MTFAEAEQFLDTYEHHTQMDYYINRAFYDLGITAANSWSPTTILAETGTEEYGIQYQVSRYVWTTLGDRD